MNTKQIMYLVGVILVCVFMLAITPKQSITREFGGSCDVYLPKGEKLVNITWKKDSLWYCTRKMKDNESAETYTFKEEAAFDIIEGTVTIIESR